MAVAIVLLSEVMLSGHPQQPPRDVHSPSPPTQTAAIRGRVVSADTGDPIRNARVSLNRGTGSIPPAFTGRDGRFSFSELPPGGYVISARRTGYADAVFGRPRTDIPPTPIHLSAGDTVDSADIRLVRAAAISGRIVDAYGDPIELANVFASRMIRVEGLVVPVGAGMTTTDDLGEYRIGGLAAGSYLLSATVPGPPPQDRAYYPGVPARTQGQLVVVGVGDERSGTDFAVTRVRLGKLTMAFAGPKGEPVDAIAFIFGLGPTLGPASSAPATAMGGEVTRMLEPGEWAIFARSGDGLIAETHVTIGLDDVSIRVPMIRGGRLTGTILADGAPPPQDISVTVAAANADFATPGIPFGSPITSSMNRVGDGGRFELSELIGSRQLRVALPRGWITTAILHDGRDILDRPVAFTGGEVMTGVQILISRHSATLRGLAVGRDGAPQSEALVVLFPEEPASEARLRRLAHVAWCDSNGQFSIEGVAPGTYLAAALPDSGDVPALTAAFLDRFRPRASRVTLASEQAVTLTLPVEPQP